MIDFIDKNLSIVTLILVIIGWFATAYFLKKNMQFEKSIDSRRQLFKIYDLFHNNTKIKYTITEISNLQSNFLIYGDNDEIKLMNEIIENMDNFHMTNFSLNKSEELYRIIINRLRKQSGLSAINT